MISSPAPARRRCRRLRPVSARAILAQDTEAIAPTADAVIVLVDGAAAWRTPRPSIRSATRPSQRGLKPEQVLSTFPAIDTAVDQHQVLAGPGADRQRDGPRDADPHATRPAISGSSCTRGINTTGTPATRRRRPSPRRTSAPSSRARSGRRIRRCPPFINIGQRFDLGEGEELKAFTTAGFLGSEFGPFNVPFPDEAADVVRPPGGMTPGRFENRDTFYRKLLEASPIGQDGSSYQRDSLLRAMDNAHRLLSSPAAKAFDLSLEPLEHIRKYVPGYDPRQQFRCRAGSLRRQVRAADGRPLRPWLPAGAAARRSRRALHRGHHRVHPVPQLGHARERPHAQRRT